MAICPIEYNGVSNMEITDNDVYCLLYSVNEIPKPITQLERSGEGGEHVVFIVMMGLHSAYGPMAWMMGRWFERRNYGISLDC